MVLTIPFALQVPEQISLYSLQLLAPRGAPAWSCFEDLQAAFGAGLTFPYALVIVPKDGTLVTSPAFFERTQNAIA
eukprot:SAG31_NODE_34880_length_328_cov_0.890830_1_plen_75_part_10